MGCILLAYDGYYIGKPVVGWVLLFYIGGVGRVVWVWCCLLVYGFTLIDGVYWCTRWLVVVLLNGSIGWVLVVYY